MPLSKASKALTPAMLNKKCLKVLKKLLLKKQTTLNKLIFGRINHFSLTWRTFL